MEMCRMRTYSNSCDHISSSLLAHFTFLTLSFFQRFILLFFSNIYTEHGHYLHYLIRNKKNFATSIGQSLCNGYDDFIVNYYMDLYIIFYIHIYVRN